MAQGPTKTSTFNERGSEIINPGYHELMCEQNKMTVKERIKKISEYDKGGRRVSKEVF